MKKRTEQIYRMYVGTDSIPWISIGIATARQSRPTILNYLALDPGEELVIKNVDGEIKVDRYDS